MDGVQLACRRRKLELGSLNELLIATVEQSRNLAANKYARPLCKACRTAVCVGSGNKHCRGSELAYELPAPNTGKRGNLKAVRANALHDLVKALAEGLSGHNGFPDSEDEEGLRLFKSRTSRAAPAIERGLWKNPETLFTREFAGTSI